MTYQLSRDYNRAWELIQQGDRLACWVEYMQDGEAVRDIAAAICPENTLIIGARGTMYVWIPNANFNLFRRACAENKIEFYLPIPNNMIVISQEDFEALASKVIKERVGNPLDELLESMEAISNGNQ